MGLPASRPKAKKLLMNAGEDGDSKALAEVVVGFASLGLLFGGDFVFLGDTGGSVDGDADNADEDAEQDDLTGGLCGGWRGSDRW